MKISGIICEYNPIHRGHILHIKKTRELTGGDTAIICIMSGNYVQRGEPAFFDKYTRAQAAVLSGADLVLELPLTCSVSSAEGFAWGGVKMLDGLGCVDFLSFGSESGKAEELKAIAQVLLSPELRAALKTELSKGMSFAAAREKAALELIGDRAVLLGSPNNLLAIEYFKALLRMNSQIEPLTIKRDSDYNSEELSTQEPTATAMRRTILENSGGWAELMPESAAELFWQDLKSGRAPVRLENAERAVFARLLTINKSELEYLPYGGEGLGQKMLKELKYSSDLAELVMRTKSKRYAHSRIRRMLLCAWLRLSDEDMALDPPYLRLLAMNGKGREVIKKINRNAGVQLITRSGDIRRMSDKAIKYFELEERATGLFNLCMPSFSPKTALSEWERSPKYIQY